MLPVEKITISALFDEILGLEEGQGGGNGRET